MDHSGGEHIPEAINKAEYWLLCVFVVVEFILLFGYYKMGLACQISLEIVDSLNIMMSLNEFFK